MLELGITQGGQWCSTRKVMVKGMNQESLGISLVCVFYSSQKILSWYFTTSYFKDMKWNKAKKKITILLDTVMFSRIHACPSLPILSCLLNAPSLFCSLTLPCLCWCASLQRLSEAFPTSGNPFLGLLHACPSHPITSHTEVEWSFSFLSHKNLPVR